MGLRIDVRKTVPDTRALHFQARFNKLGISKKATQVWVADSFVIDALLQPAQIKKIAAALVNPIVEESFVNSAWAPEKFSFAVEIGYLPGVTDNIGNTCKEMIADLLNKKFKSGESVYSSKIFFVAGVTEKDAEKIADSLHNPLIQRAKILSAAEYIAQKGFGAYIPRVKLPKPEPPTKVDLEVSDDELVRIGKQGILSKDGTRRGPLALDLEYMKAIREHFRTLKRKPTDIELETLAQTWSEHCKHTILNSPIDEITEGLFRTYIKNPTDTIRTRKGEKDFCVSVFKDNSGAIVFDDEYLITHKVETHNSPSALDPFGGAITGIVGVNRDALGFGLGARPVANTYGFCLSDPRDKRDLWRDSDRNQKMLSSRRIMDGVIEGVRAGGNQSGIPTPHGFLSYDPRYRGKPLVFVGTLGLIPRQQNGRKLHEKKAVPGDYIVMIGGRVGQDGIHGATFSSEAIDSGSPATAVQIGDPITQKKFTDALINDARDLDLYNSITDNGAGGLSSSIGEMAKESGGAQVDLDKVPLKYPGLSAWQIWISESQERMTLAIPPAKWKQFNAAMKRHDVEATIIGKFTDSEKCVVTSRGKRIVELSLDFMHRGLPVRELHSKRPMRLTLRGAPESRDVKKDMLALLSRPTVASRAFITDQYDHEVQASSVIKPLQGRGRVDGDAAVIKPVLTSQKGVVIADALYPTYSDIDTYEMAAASIDSAVRAAIVAGAPPEKIALLDNFCWCSPFDEVRLYELKLAAKACFDAALAYDAPYISGKDSMFNDFKGFDDKGPVSISVPPTLLVTAIAVMDDVRKAMTIDFKRQGDHIYILGETNAEIGGSEYSQMISEREKSEFGGDVPHVSFEKNAKIYTLFAHARDRGLIASAISVGRGGLAVAFAKSSMAGMLGMDVDIFKLPGNAENITQKLFSESQGRILLTVPAGKASVFEKSMLGVECVRIGSVTSQKNIRITSERTFSIPLAQLIKSYRSTFEGF